MFTVMRGFVTASYYQLLLVSKATVDQSIGSDAPGSMHCGQPCHCRSFKESNLATSKPDEFQDVANECK